MKTTFSLPPTLPMVSQQTNVYLCSYQQAYRSRWQRCGSTLKRTTYCRRNMTQEDKIKAVLQRAIDNGWSIFGYREREHGEGEVVWQYQHPTLIVQLADEDGN